MALPLIIVCLLEYMNDAGNQIKSPLPPFLFEIFFVYLWYENTFNYNTDIDRTFNSLCRDGYELLCFDGSYGNCDSYIYLLWCLFNCKPQHDKQRS